MNQISKIRTFFVLLSCLISVLVFAALLEGALRFGVIENSQYDRRQTQKKARYKLLILGDSFILPRSLLAESLARDLSGHDVSVLNAAMNGTGPFEYLAEMKAVGMNFKPDVVLLSYYVGLSTIDRPNAVTLSAITPCASCDKSWIGHANRSVYNAASMRRKTYTARRFKS